MVRVIACFSDLDAMEGAAVHCRCSGHRPCSSCPCLSRAGCSARRNPQGRTLVPVDGRRQLGATEDIFGRVNIAVVQLTTVSTYPLSDMERPVNW
jgi:hypothetical protein